MQTKLTVVAFQRRVDLSTKGTFCNRYSFAVEFLNIFYKFRFIAERLKLRYAQRTLVSLSLCQEVLFGGQMQTAALKKSVEFVISRGRLHGKIGNGKTQHVMAACL